MSQQFPKWTKRKDGGVTISFPPGWIEGLADDLNDWDMGSWVHLDDCKNWKRSPIARENRRETIVYSNCLSVVMAYLGRREMLKIRQKVKAEQPKPAAP